MATKMSDAALLRGTSESNNVIMNLGRYDFVLVLVSALTILLGLALLICGYLEAWHTPWFEERYAPTIAIAHGFQIYHVPPDGPLIVCLYAPLSYLTFLPAAFLPTIQAVFAGGSFLATAFLAIPFALVAWYFAKEYRLKLSEWGPLLLVPFTAIASLRSLSYIATFVTSDAPSTCLMAISIWLLYRGSRRGAQPTAKTAIYSSLALALSLGCKQNMVFGAVTLIAAAFYFFGRKFGRLYLAYTAIFGVLALGLVVAIFHDIRAIYFNSVLIGLRYTVVKANLFPGTYRFFANAAVLGLILIAMWLVLFLTKGSEPRLQDSRRILIFFLVAGVIGLSDIRFYAVRGGDVNDLSHGLYIFILGLVATGFEFLLLTRSNPKATLALRIIAVAGALALVGSGLPTRYDAAWKAKMRHTPSGITAYEFDKEHPGQVYFPFNPISVYLAEHRFYTTEWGVVNLWLAYQQFTPQELLKFAPENARYVAAPRDYNTDDQGVLIPYIAPHRLKATVPGLEKNFIVYSIER